MIDLLADQNVIKFIFTTLNSVAKIYADEF